MKLPNYFIVCLFVFGMSQLAFAQDCTHTSYTIEAPINSNTTIYASDYIIAPTEISANNVILQAQNSITLDAGFSFTGGELDVQIGTCGNGGTGSTPPTQEWISEVTGSQAEAHGHFILTCTDGGYLQVGETGFIPNSAKLMVAKTDANGNALWTREVNVGGHNLGNSAFEISDGYMICGALNKNSALIKLNKNTGAIIWQQSYNNGGTDGIEHVAETPTGFAAVGYVNALDPNNTFYTEGEGFLMFLDNSGDVISTQNINSYTSHAYRIINYNNALIISGLSAGAEDYNVLKMDFSGNVIWNKTYGGNNQDHCFGLDVNASGEIFLTGHTLSGTQNWDTYTMKLDNNGNQLWEAVQGNPRGFNPLYIHDETWGNKATSDGGCVIVAGTGDEYTNYTSCNNNGCSDVWHTYLVKFDNNGNLQWETTFGDPNNGVDWAGEDIDLTPDGGAIIAVDNSQFGFLKVSAF